MAAVGVRVGKVFWILITLFENSVPLLPTAQAREARIGNISSQTRDLEWGRLRRWNSG
jgi:hypothetical protein